MWGNTPYPLERNNGNVTHHDIYVSLEHYGYPLISHVPLEQGRVLPVETLVLEILDKTTHIREAEGIPIILSRTGVSPKTLTANARRRGLTRKTGYICELALRLFEETGITENREELKTAADELYPHNEDEEIALVQGLPAELVEHFRQNDYLERKWGIVGCVDYSSIKKLLKKR